MEIQSFDNGNELPSEWEDILNFEGGWANSILSSITRDDVLNTAKTRCRVDEEDKTVYLDGELFDLESEHIVVAVAILKAHPRWDDIRFKLVPGKLKDGEFWAAIFGLLSEDDIAIEEKHDDNTVDAAEEDDSVGSEDEEGALLPQSKNLGKFHQFPAI